MASSSRALALLLAAAAGCAAERALPTPAPAAVEPAIGYRTSEIPVTIRGADFHVRAELSVEGAAGTRTLASYRAWLGETELLDVVRVDAQTLTATVPAGIAGGTHALVVEGPYATRGSVAAAYVALATVPPLLTVTAVAPRHPVTVGEDALFDVTATNLGPGTMRDVQPIVKQIVAGTRRVPLPARPAVVLAEGESFTWRYGGPALEPGTLVYEAKASAIEVVTGAGVSAERAGVTIRVETPPSLSLVASLGSGVVTVGDTVTASLLLTNLGEAAARVVPSASPSGTATLEGALALPELVVPGGATVGPLAFSLAATGPGTSEIVLSAAGEDVSSGAPVSASASAGSVLVLPPPELRAVLRATGPDPASPELIPAGSVVTLTLTLENVGEGTATNVRPAAPAEFDPGYPPLAHGPVASETPPFDLAPGAIGTVVWRFEAAEPGIFAVTCRAASDGHASAAASTGAAVSSELAVVAWEPLGPSTTASLLASLGGQLVVGPDRSGTGFARLAADGGELQALALRVAADVTGPNVATNAAGLEGGYPTFGAPGCASDGVPRTCGPDGELAPGLLASGPLGGDDWLVYGGARDGQLDYVYLAREPQAPLAFAYADLSAALPASTESLSAALPAGDRLYLGFAAPDRPALVALRSLPAGAGLDATLADAADLGLAAALDSVAPGVPAAPPGRLATVDALQLFGGRLYVFGSFGCLVAEDERPSGPGAFASCSHPSTRASIAPPDARGVRPGERAHPQVAIWGGRLLAARNTADGPQLLACEAALGALADACEPGDWRLVATNRDGALDGGLTQLDDAANQRIALLAATERHLYLGFEGPRGLRVFRTSEAAPATPAAFAGAGGAPAGPGVAGLGGDGLRLGATRVHGALTFPDRAGKPAVFLLVGDGAGPVRLVRLVD